MHSLASATTQTESYTLTSFIHSSNLYSSEKTHLSSYSFAYVTAPTESFKLTCATTSSAVTALSSSHLSTIRIVPKTMYSSFSTYTLLDSVSAVSSQYREIIDPTQSVRLTEVTQNITTPRDGIIPDEGNERDKILIPVITVLISILVLIAVIIAVTYTYLRNTRIYRIINNRTKIDVLDHPDFSFAKRGAGFVKSYSYLKLQQDTLF